MNVVELAERLLGERRLSPALAQHARGVARTARELAQRHGADPDHAEAAGLLHDWCRDWSRQEVLDGARKHELDVDALEREFPVPLLHARLAAAELAGRGLPADVLQAIGAHTVGGPGLGTLARCLFVADAIEPGRRYAGVAEARAAARRSLDEAVALVAKRDIERLRSRGRAVHPRMLAMMEESSGTQDRGISQQ